MGQAQSSEGGAERAERERPANDGERKEPETVAMREALKKINITYVWIFLLYYTVFDLMPVTQLLAKPGWNRVSVWMLYFGLTLFIVNLIVDREEAFGRHIIWILLLCAAFAAATIIRRRYNHLYANRLNLIYCFLQPFMLYAAGRLMSKQEKKRFVFSWYTIVSAIFIPALCYMFYQFFSLQHYLAGTMSQGWFEGRLFGVMRVLYNGSIIVGVLAFLAGYYLFCSKRKVMKVIYSIELGIYVLYLSLSDTRTVFVGCAVGLGFIIYQRCYRKDSADANRRKGGWLIRGTCAFIIAILLLFAGTQGIRTAALFCNWQAHGGAAGTGVSFREFTEGEDRPEQGTYSSRRVDIWKSYFEIMADNPSHVLFGTSFYGKAEYIREHYPEQYIVRDFARFYPQDAQRGSVYGEHNAYLSVWVRTGIPGLIGFMGFLLACAGTVLQRVRAGTGSSFACALTSVVLLLLAAAFFEEDICFRISASSCIFWVFAGFLMNAAEGDRT